MLDCNKKKDDAVENKYLFRSRSAGPSTVGARNIARYINHACKPNAESDVSAASARSLSGHQEQSSPAEINYDYGTDYFKEYLKADRLQVRFLREEAQQEGRRGEGEKLKLKAKREEGAEAGREEKLLNATPTRRKRAEAEAARRRHPRRPRAEGESAKAQAAA